MIFITLGTLHKPFNRLAMATNHLTTKLKHQSFIIQTGHTQNFKKHSNVSLQPFFSFYQTSQLIKQADVIISHAGEATIIQALCLNKIPIIVPRDCRYHEHIDNQQLTIANSLKKKRLAIVVNKPQDLTATVVQYQALSKKCRPFIPNSKPSLNLINYLNQLT